MKGQDFRSAGYGFIHLPSNFITNECIKTNKLILEDGTKFDLARMSEQSITDLMALHPKSKGEAQWYAEFIE